jgi:hypothetical protein
MLHAVALHLYVQFHELKKAIFSLDQMRTSMRKHTLRAVAPLVCAISRIKKAIFSLDLMRMPIFACECVVDAQHFLLISLISLNFSPCSLPSSGTATVKE